MKKRYPPSWLPNQPGFRFTGINAGGERRSCIVKLNEIGCHSAYDEITGEACYSWLSGWEHI